MTALGEKLISHNLAMPRMDSPLYMAMLEFKKKGGGYDRARMILDRAYGRGLTNDDAENSAPLSERTASSISIASSPQASGMGHSVHAHPRHSRPAVPARTPLNLTGDVALGVRNVLAQSVFDRVKTNDGRAWGDVGAHELDGMSRDGAFAMALKNKIGTLSNAQRFMTVRELITVDKFEQARNEAHGS